MTSQHLTAVSQLCVHTNKTKTRDPLTKVLEVLKILEKFISGHVLLLPSFHIISCNLSFPQDHCIRKGKIVQNVYDKYYSVLMPYTCKFC